MADFIEVHQLGKPRLVNLDWVEEMWPTENGTQIYFAFTCPDATSQDFITTDESYDKIKRIIAYQRVERGQIKMSERQEHLAEVYQRIFGHFCDSILRQENINRKEEVNDENHT